jgi:chromatin assembly factor 1 subunit B
MKLYPQEVYLHGLGKFPDYCYSLDVCWSPQSSGPTYIVTGGADSIARVWTVNDKFQLEIHSELTGHQLGVNCVRFSPDGLNSIATASDDGKVVVWKREVPEDSNTDRWVQGRILNVLDEVVSIAWSPCGTMIAAAVQREMTHIFSAVSGKLLARLDGHTNRVSGVAWDPLGQLVVSQSSDRTARVYARKRNGSWYPKALLKEVSDAKQEDLVDGGSKNKWKMFISESHYPNDPTAHFFRRPDFSPDGSTIVLPGGLTETFSGENTKFSVQLFSRKALATNQPPAAVFITPCSPSICVRFHPRPFLSEGVAPFYVYVITTVNSFYVMRSDKTVPIAFGTDIHCTSIVDASWSSDAQLLGLSSTDGYITLIRFEVGELGGIPDWSTFSIKVSTPPLDTKQQQPWPEHAHEKYEKPNVVSTKRRITPMVISG